MAYQTYPDIISRVKAVLIDALVLILLMYLATLLLAYFEDPKASVRIAVLVFIIVLYDPLFTSIWGGTIGHIINGLRVTRLTDPEKNILFPLAVLRFILKTALGWISLLSVTGDDKKRAIHDIAIGSL